MTYTIYYYVNLKIDYYKPLSFKIQSGCRTSSHCVDKMYFHILFYRKEHYAHS